MTIEETLMVFDQVDKKGYDYHEILAALSSMDEMEKAKTECVYEALAFRLVPSSGENPWGFYFGPQFTFEDKDGNPIYVLILLRLRQMPLRIGRLDIENVRILFLCLGMQD